MIYKASGLMTFVQGDIMTLGAFLGLTFYGVLKLPYWLTLVLTVAIAFIFGMLLEKGIIRRLLNKNVLQIYVVLATIAIANILQNAIQLNWGGNTLSFPSIFNVMSVKALGVNIQPERLLSMGIALVVMIILHFFMSKTRLGTSMRAAAMDPMAAQACGIDVSLITGVTWGFPLVWRRWQAY